MHSNHCRAFLSSLETAGIQEHHLSLLLAHPGHLHASLKFAMSLAALESNEVPPFEVLDLPGGNVAFRQAAQPLPFAAKDWQFYLRQRNAKAPDHLRCDFDASKPSLFSEAVLLEPLAPEVSSIYLIDTAQARVRPEQAHDLLASIAPDSKRLTRPTLLFEVLRYFWDRITNLNAAYIVINAEVKGVGYPVVFNSLSSGKRVTFVPGIPQQHEAYTGYYACCA